MSEATRAYDAPFYRFRVWIRSVPGMYAQYDGKVDVTGRDESEAQESAFRQLKRGSFPERSRAMWRVERIECLGTCE